MAEPLDPMNELRTAIRDLIEWANLERETSPVIECDPALLGELERCLSTRLKSAVAKAPTQTASTEERRSRAAAALAAIAERVARCTRCPLHRTRHRTVPGQGNPAPELMFIGEGPGEEEDRQGLAFVGPAGQLLTRLIHRMGLTREDVFIANIVKCRPTINDAGVRDRPPTDEEMAACIPYLLEQIEVLQPKVIVCLGATALYGLLHLKGISRLRGHWQEFRGIPVMPTYHPSYLLRSGGDQRARYWEVWDDMVQVLQRLGRPVPDVGRRRPSAPGPG